MAKIKIPPPPPPKKKETPQFTRITRIKTFFEAVIFGGTSAGCRIIENVSMIIMF